MIFYLFIFNIDKSLIFKKPFEKVVILFDLIDFYNKRAKFGHTEQDDY